MGWFRQSRAHRGLESLSRPSAHQYSELWHSKLWRDPAAAWTAATPSSLTIAAARRERVRVRELMILRLLMVATLSVLAWPAHAAITRDAASQTKCTGSTCALSHTIAAANLEAIITVHMFGTSSVPTVTAATIGGSPATFVGNVTNPSCAGGQCAIQLWRLTNPPTGLQSVSVTLSQTSQIILGVATYAGVDPPTPLGTLVSGIGTSSAPSINLSTASGEVVVGALTITNAGSTPTPTGGGSSYYADIDLGGSFHGAGSDQSAVSGSTAYGWTYGTSQNYALLAVPLKAAGTGGGGGGFSTERLVWTDLSSGLRQETNTRVYWKHSTQPTYQIIATLIPDSSTYTVSYTTQTDRCYVVDQINSVGVSPLSNVLCAAITAPGPIVQPLTPPPFGGGLSDD